MTPLSHVRRRTGRFVVGAIVIFGLVGAGSLAEVYPAWVGVVLEVAIVLAVAMQVRGLRAAAAREGLVPGVDFPIPGQRIADAVFGLLLLGIAIAIVVVEASPWSVGVIVTTVVFALLGVEALAAAWRERPSLVSRLGPLP